MKTKITLLVLIVFGGLLLSTSCEKATEKLLEKLTPEFSADVDGTTWKTKDVFALKSDSGFSITAAEDTVMFMFFIKEFKNGKYDISNSTEAAATYTIGDSPDIHIGLSGEIEVIEAEDNGVNFDIKFHFMAVNIVGDTVYITNGEGKNIINPI